MNAIHSAFMGTCMYLRVSQLLFSVLPQVIDFSR